MFSQSCGPGAEGAGAAAPAGCLFMTLLIHSGSAGGAGRGGAGGGAGIKRGLELSRAGRRRVEHSALDVVTGEKF